MSIDDSDLMGKKKDCIRRKVRERGGRGRRVGKRGGEFGKEEGRK